MRPHRSVFLVLVLALALGAPVAGQTTTYAAAADSGRAWIATFMARQHIPGVSVAVGIRGAVVWSEGFGWANLADSVPVTTGTMFRIGSVSKPLTADAVAHLVEAGKLDLDAPVQRYVPDFPRKRWPVTTRLLAGHLAGVRHYRGTEFLLNRAYPTVRSGLAVFEEDSLLYEPGTRFSYSTYGWNVISAVVEGASGRDFLRYMHDAVFAPLGLSHTAPDRKDSVIPERTAFYQVEGDRAVIAPEVDNSYKWAGGGFLSTPEDLIRFASAHLAPGYLRAATLDLLFTSQATTAGEAVGYGIGWRVATDQAGRRTVGHSGGSIGGTTMLLVYRDLGVVVAIVANISNANYGSLPPRLGEAFIAASPPPRP